MSVVAHETHIYTLVLFSFPIRTENRIPKTEHASMKNDLQQATESISSKGPFTINNVSQKGGLSKT